MRTILAILAVILVMAAPIIAQEIDYCEGDFDYDGDCDGTDAARFKLDFGRSVFQNPCPPDGPIPVQKTGQTTSYATGDDGDWKKGAEWTNPRFTDNSDGTVTDNMTGLIWLESANCIVSNYPGFDNDYIAGDGRVTWQHALDFVSGINAGTYPDCGAGSTEWRLPNRNELTSLVHKGYYEPALPNTAGTGQWTEGDPFINVQPMGYWSSTTSADSADVAWYVGMGNGGVKIHYPKTYHYYVWPVRGGH